jgi:hypothetical protein
MNEAELNKKLEAVNKEGASLIRVVFKSVVEAGWAVRCLG